MKYPLYNETLCPDIWTVNEDGAHLNDDVRKNLLKIAIDFIKDLRENNKINVKIEDVLLVGSITNYNWTPYSDVDVHIVADYTPLGINKETAQTMFDAIKTGWNKKHNITMKGFDVELYVEDIDHETESASVYSILRDEWVKEPVKQKPNFNKSLIKKKYNEYKKKIDELIKGESEKPLKDLLDKLNKYRQAGLDSGGELSEENIVFKMLRAKGYLDKLKQNIVNIYDDKMSVDESKKISISDIHKLADEKGIKWDNEPSFLELTMELTGFEHLDDLDQDGLKKIKNYLNTKNSVPPNKINEGESDIAKSVYQYGISRGIKSERNGNSMVMYVIPTNKQMEYLRNKSGEFMYNNSRVSFTHDRHEPTKIKFTWNF